jgi:hypothetical protein
MSGLRKAAFSGGRFATTTLVGVNNKLRDNYA